MEQASRIRFRRESEMARAFFLAYKYARGKDPNGRWYSLKMFMAAAYPGAED